MQKYLDLKEQMERMQRLALSSAQEAYRRECERLALIDRELAAVAEYCREAGGTLVDVQGLLLAEAYRNELAERRERQTLAVAEALERLHAERERLLSLQRHRKLLERLREKLWQEHCRKLLLEEQKCLDEIGTDRFVRLGGKLA